MCNDDSPSTEAIENEQALKASRERLELGLEVNQQGLWDWNLVTGESYVTSGFRRLLGYEEDDAEPNLHGGFSLVHPDDRPAAEKLLHEHLEGRCPKYEAEVRLRKKNGEYLRVLSRGKLVSLDASGHPVRMILTHSDVSERSRLEQRLRQAQRMEAIGLLASGIAHDFNNLLTVMNGCSEMLFSKGQVPPEARECLEMIRDCGERAATLIRRLLTFGRQQPQEPKAISLNEVVTDLSGLLRRLLPENIEFTTRLEAHSGTVAADPSLIQHALMNLAINARDAMPEGGRLEIGTSSLKLGASISESHLHMPPGNYVVLTVNDTGVGMDEVTQEHLFEPFFTTKPVGMGTGLGLSTVYGIVKQSGGRISVYSEKGKGTGFKIYLPYAEGERTEINVAQRESPEGGHETILVVEDNAEVRQFMRTVLEGLGYTILEAASGEEAALISQTHLGGIDLLIADVVLPDSTGNDIARQLTETRPGVAVLFISGYTQSFAVQERTLEPAVDFLEKPFSGDELAMRIREILRKPRRTRILIVDDDPALARFASQVLGDAGYEILVANNGNDALSIIDNQRVDLMITDLVMPEKEGLEMIVALRKSKSRLPIIAVSGVFVGDLLKTARALGAQATIEKPFSVATLLEVVQRVLRTAHS